MKAISIKLDDYIVEVLNRESKEKKTTRMELIRTAIMDFLLRRDDAGDLAYIDRHRKDKLLSFQETFHQR